MISLSLNFGPIFFSLLLINSLFLLLFFFYKCFLNFVCFALSHFPPILQLSLSHTLDLLLQPSLSPFYLILSSPLCYSSLSFPQEEPQSYLGYVGFGELKSHFANSLSASPENSAGYLKRCQHLPGFIRWNAACQATFYSL